MVKVDKKVWKYNFITRATKLLSEYNKCFIVQADNVVCHQLQEIRMALRGHGVLLWGKNTVLRKVLRDVTAEKNNNMDIMIPDIACNVGLVLTDYDLCEIRNIIMENKKRAPAKAGALAPVDVLIPAQNTGLGPEKTSFFQSLQIATKISRGTIEIVNDVQLLRVGNKVGMSEATLLNMLNISPFTYGLKIMKVFDNGCLFTPEVLDIDNDQLLKVFQEGLHETTAISLAVGYPSILSLPHMMATGVRNLLAIAAATDVTFKEAETMKEYLKDPSKFAVAAVAAAPVAAAAAEEKPKEVVAKVEEEEEESDDDMGFGLFD